MKYFLIFILVGLSSFLSAQIPINNELKLAMSLSGFAIEEIAAYGIIEGPTIGLVGSKSKQFERFDLWQNSVSEEEMLRMTNHHSPVVRSYAFWGLIKHNSSLYRDVLNKHLNDHELLDVVIGCIVEKMSVYEFMKRIQNGQVNGIRI